MVYLAKVIGNVIVICVMEVVALPVFAMIYNVPVVGPRLLPILALGTLGVAAVGTLFAAMAANARARELLMPVLIFPLMVPVVIAAVRATAALMSPSRRRAVGGPARGLRRHLPEHLGRRLRVRGRGLRASAICAMNGGPMQVAREVAGGVAPQPRHRPRGALRVRRLSRR